MLSDKKFFELMKECVSSGQDCAKVSKAVVSCFSMIDILDTKCKHKTKIRTQFKIGMLRTFRSVQVAGIPLQLYL